MQQGRWNDFESEELKWMLSLQSVLKEIVERKGASEDPRHQLWKNFISYAEEAAGLRIDDPYPYFIENAESRSMVWSLTDKHPSCAAHGLMAEHVADSLAR